MVHLWPVPCPFLRANLPVYDGDGTEEHDLLPYGFAVEMNREAEVVDLVARRRYE
jgi:hypothetical protein